MEIELGKKEAYIDLKQFPHILMTGSAGIGKTYTILNIVAQICDTENAGVIYLSDDTKDFKKVEYLCDDFVCSEEEDVIELLDRLRHFGEIIGETARKLYREIDMASKHGYYYR